MVVIASSLSWESMNCFQWRIFMRRFWASAVRRSLRLRGCSGGNWGREGPGFWGCTVLLGRWDLFCQWWRTRQQPEQFCVKQECAFFWASWGGGFLWRHSTLLGVWELGELFSSAAFHQKKNRRGQAVGEPPGTKTITKTKRREIWMTHYEHLFEYT